MPGRPKVLAIASAGGHWVQMQLLAKAAFADYEVAFVSTYADQAEAVAGHRFYRITDVTRRNVPRMVRTSLELVRVLLKERPDVVVTTGALPGLLGIVLAKTMTHARTVWIDSIANCDEMSSSGKQARRFADRWLTQWPELAGPGGPEYWGALI
ncbi:MAG TPA: glycosyltransferase [Caulobacteraceae bacterium]|nr:glycosyltransferase [Caulobacteraceae bacterium]